MHLGFVGHMPILRKSQFLESKASFGKKQLKGKATLVRKRCMQRRKECKAWRK
jgi:hypothetical protein